MDSKFNEPGYKLRWTGLWFVESKRRGGDYWRGGPLREEDIEKFIEFSRLPTKLVVFKNIYKSRKTEPDAYVWLYRHVSSEQWLDRKEHPEKYAKHEADNKETKKEDTPF